MQKKSNDHTRKLIALGDTNETKKESADQHKKNAKINK